MSVDGSVTNLIGRLGDGEQVVAQAIWDRYFPRLLELARAKLRGIALQEADEEDVALSAIHTFFQAAARNNIPQLRNRDDLWRALVLITAGKAVDQRRRQQSLKRGGPRKADGQAAGHGQGHGPDWHDLHAVAGHEPDPQFAAQVAEELQTLLGLLDDDRLREIALLKLEGYSNEEIAARLGCSDRTVTRRLTVIRRTWGASAEDPAG